MQSKCIVCHDKPAVFRCIQCHKPVCDDCSFKIEHGAFCSRECAVMYRDFKRSQRDSAPRRPGRFLARLVALILVAAMVVAALYVMGIIKDIPGLPTRANAPQARPAE